MSARHQRPNLLHGLNDVAAGQQVLKRDGDGLQAAQRLQGHRLVLHTSNHAHHIIVSCTNRGPGDEAALDGRVVLLHQRERVGCCTS